MGEKLTSAVQVRNVIEIVVRSKIVSGEKAAKRAQKIGDMDEVKDLKHKADKGDLYSLVELGKLYAKGEKGLEKMKHIQPFSSLLAGSELDLMNVSRTLALGAPILDPVDVLMLIGAGSELDLMNVSRTLALGAPRCLTRAPQARLERNHKKRRGSRGFKMLIATFENL